MAVVWPYTGVNIRQCGLFAVKYMSIDKYEYDGYGGMPFTLYGDIIYEEYSIYRLLSLTCKYKDVYEAPEFFTRLVK